MTMRASLLCVATLALAACAETAPLTAPDSGATTISAKGAKAPSANIPVETVGPGLFPLAYELQETGTDAQGRSFWVEEVSTGYDATGEPVGSMVLHVSVLDTATVRTTIRKIRQRTGWVATIPKESAYDNKAARVTWRSGKLSVTVSVLHEPGRTVDDHGVVR
jgi:hypothetical protein